MTTATATAATTLHSERRAASTTMADKPRSIEELTRAAKYKFDAAPEFFALVTGTQDLLHQAEAYEAEGDLESAYIMFCRSYKMSVEEIPKHRDFATSGQAVADRLVSISARALRDMLRLRPVLEANHKAWVESRSLEHARSISSSPSDTRTALRSHISPSSDTGKASLEPLSGTKQRRELPTPPLSSSNMPYITLLQTKESERPSYVRTISSPVIIQQRSQSVPASTSPSSVVTTRHDPLINRGEIRQMDTSYTSRPISMPPTRPSYSKGIQPGPLLDSKRIQAHGSTMSEGRSLPIPPVQAGYQDHPRKPATMIPLLSHESRPPMMHAGGSHRVSLPPKPVAIRIPIMTTEDSSTPLSRSRNASPSHSRSPEGSRAYKASLSPAYSSDSTRPDEPRLRTLLLPPNLIQMFAGVAAPNTERNIETCGFIMGHLKENVLIANLLVIPKQTGTSDTCTTMSEEEIWTVTDREGVIFLGWIHTHPRHDCFLSSKDLHTQAGYQQLLPEAIAIVIAPTAKPSIGIFRLTDPPGLSIISNCKQGNDFHPHYEVGPLYVDAYAGVNEEEGGGGGENSRDGHVMIVRDELKCRLIDLR